MKKLLCIILSILLIASTMGVTAFAENTVTVDGVIYEFDNESQTYTVVGTDVAQIYAANGCVSDKIDVLSYQNVVNTALNV